jgi:type IV pilus assembly protein PilA
MFCTQCGEKNLEQAKFCFSCGSPLAIAQSIPIPPLARTPVPDSQVVNSPEDNVGTSAVHRPASKRCPSCGLPNRGSAERCACGYSFAQKRESETRSVAGTAAQVPVEGNKRPGVITLLAVLQLIGAVLLTLIALVCLGAGLFADTTDAGALVLGGILFGVLGALEGACGFGLWKLKGYGRKIHLVFSWIGLIGFPVGTIISILILVYLYKPGVKVLFAGKPGSQFTPEEAAQVADLRRGSVGTVLAVAAIALVAIAVIGIIAAIAVPGLLRARIAGNEASAIGSLRAINDAQDRYAQKCSGYAPDLPELKRAGDFLSGDLTIAPTVTKSGYNIALERSATARLVTNMPVGCVGSITEYVAHADPVTAGGTGTRYFGTDSRRIIFQDATAPIANPIAVTARPVR